MTRMRLAGIDRVATVILVETGPFMTRKSSKSEEGLHARKPKFIEN
jgi:hypothetical protein